MKHLIIPGLALALGVTFATSTAVAHPYATCLTNNAGTVSFRLNETADAVRVIWDGGSTNLDLGPRGVGLTITNVGATDPFQVEVFKVGSGAVTRISNEANTNLWFYGPRAVGINIRPASPYFGRVYVGNNPGTTTSPGSRLTEDGIYMVNADGTDAVGQGNTARTAGINMTTGGNSMPWRLSVGEDDDMVYICDWSDAAGNLWQTDPNVSDGSGVAVFMAPIGSMAAPLDPAMNHGSVAEVAVTGSLAAGNLTVYTVDEDYETNPSFLVELNSIWQYNISSGPFPWSAMPNAKIGTPSVNNVGQTMGLKRATNGFFYLLDYRSAGGQNLLQVFDPVGPTELYQSFTNSTALGFTYDVLSNSQSVAISPDMKYCATIRNNGSVTVMPMVNGIPDLSKRFTFAAGSTGRDIEFDAADNLYVIHSGTERLRVYSIGLTTTATTGTDGTFNLIMPDSVAVTVDADTVYEAGGSTAATFTLKRTGASTVQPLAVTLNLSGTAASGSDYVLQTNAVTLITNVVIIPAGSDSAAVSLVAQNDTTSELTETATLGVTGSKFYTAGSPPSATVAIVDNDPATADLAVVYPSMYERLTADYARLRVVRRGDTNAPSFNVNLTYSGTAAPARYTGPATVTVDPGVVNQNFDITPVDDGALNGNQAIVATVVSGSGYAVGTNSPSATATIVDDDLPPEDVIWSENFNTDSLANWTVQFNSGNGVNDYRLGAPAPPAGTYSTSYDYASGGWFPAIPAAPHATSDTLGLFLTVNKDEASGAGAAGINLYPNGKSFSGNYAVRFDMYLMVGNAASTTEYALFGINHSGTKANWFRNSTGGVTNGPSFDGLFFGVESDGAALGDYVIYSAPTTSGSNPTALTPGVNASTLTGIFKNPPYGPTLILPGAPGCDETTTTPSWSDVEISQVNGVVTLTINRTPIMSYANTTAFTSGNIMLGYCDAYDSIMAGNSVVVYDNLRVIRLASTTAPNITRIQIVAGNVEISFTADASDTPTSFTLQGAGTVSGTYGDVSSTITGSGGSFKAVRTLDGTQQFYRLKRN